MKRKSLLAALVLSLFAAGGAQAQAPAPKPINISLGSVASSSGVYAFSVSLANAVRKHDPGINVTVVEGGGGFDHARLMKQGVLDWSISGSPAVVQEVRTGTDNFKREGAWEPVRLMFMRNMNVNRIYVRADAAKKDNIRSWADLKGKRISPGVPGTRDMTRILDANKLLGTGVQLVPGSLDDSLKRLVEGGAIGMAKGSPFDRFDTGMQEAHRTTPLTVVGFSKADADKLIADDPFNTLAQSTGIREVPDLGATWEMTSAVMVMSSSRMTQETGYRIMRAVSKGWDEITRAFPAAAGSKPVEDAFAATPNVQGMHFHAGVIQYAREAGISVPQRLVPPEYKGK